jgi:hypothetical protein
MSQSLTDAEAAQLRAHILAQGLEAVAEQLQLNTITLLRAAVGLQLHNATRLVIQQRLRDAS